MLRTLDDHFGCSNSGFLFGCGPVIWNDLALQMFFYEILLEVPQFFR